MTTDSYTATLNEIRRKSAGEQACKLYAKLVAEREAMQAATINWALYTKLADITFDLAGIIGSLGFNLEGEQQS